MGFRIEACEALFCKINSDSSGRQRVFGIRNTKSDQCCKGGAM